MLDHIREIVGVGRDGIRPLRLVALAMPAQVDRYDPVPLGEVRGLRREERVIARPPWTNTKAACPHPGPRTRA